MTDRNMIELYVSTILSPQPEPFGSRQSPHPSIQAALKHLRSLRVDGPTTPATIYLVGGVHRIDRSIELSPVDSNLTFAAIDGETPVIDGGVPITGWSVTTHAGRVAWVADVSAILREHGGFRSLFVNSERRPRPTLPKQGWFRIESAPDVDPHNVKLFQGGDRFVARPGDFQAWKNLQDAEVVVSHFWSEERMPVISFDESTRMVVSSHTSIFTLTDAWDGQFARYRVENVGQALSEPGEWYLDRAAGTLTYLPRDGESIESTQVVVPVLHQLLRVVGDEAGVVSGVKLRGITFRHADWIQPPGFGLYYKPHVPVAQRRRRDSFDHFCGQVPGYDRLDFANTPQAALHVPGAIHFEHATECLLDRCTIHAVGWHGVSFDEGCRGITITHCHLHDLGAGGIVADGGGVASPLNRRTGGIQILHSRIHNTGHVWLAACGITLAFADDNLIEHNEIFDTTYTGISIGWCWGFAPHVARDNRVCHNHIHHLAQRGGLSDLGGIYTLGVQPGTVLRGNRIHHVTGASYGGNGIYLDEGSSSILVEQNVVHDCTGSGVSEHFGRDNRIVDNIIAFTGTPRSSANGAKGSAFEPCGERSHDVPWPARRTWFMRNIVVGSDTRLMLDNSTHLLEDCHVVSDLNIFWDVTVSNPFVFETHLAPHAARAGETPGTTQYTLAQWQALGFDRHSVVADPRFVDVAARNFAILPDSPAHALGIGPCQQ